MHGRVALPGSDTSSLAIWFTHFLLHLLRIGWIAYDMIFISERILRNHLVPVEVANTAILAFSGDDHFFGKSSPLIPITWVMLPFADHRPLQVFPHHVLWDSRRRPLTSMCYRPWWWWPRRVCLFGSLPALALLASSLCDACSSEHDWLRIHSRWRLGRIQLHEHININAWAY